MKNKWYKKRNDIKYNNAYTKIKTQVQKEQREAYQNYIELIICDLPLNEPDQPPAKNQTKPKKLFQYIKSTRTDNSGIAALCKGSDLIADTIEKADMLNEQCQSVFTSESDDPIPDKGTSKHPNIPPLTISTPGIKKLLNNINHHKATDPHNISGRVLIELQEKTVPTFNLIFTHTY